MRSCDGCTKCCEGWLSGEAHGHKFWPGRPCHFQSSKGCSIYENRPDEPCKSFKCLWLIDEGIPEWMKPDMIDVIVAKQPDENGKLFIELSEAGSRMDPKVLSWFFMKYVEGTIDNLRYKIDGSWNFISRNEGDVSGEK